MVEKTLKCEVQRLKKKGRGDNIKVNQKLPHLFFKAKLMIFQGLTLAKLNSILLQ